MPLQQSNQFGMSVIKGMPDQHINFNTKTVRIDPASVAAANTFQPGQAVKLVNKAGAKEIIVDVCASITGDVVYGVILYNLRKNVYVAGDIVEIACAGDVVYLEASAAIQTGTKVATTAATRKVATNSTASNQITGIALEPAAADGDLIRVEITPSTNPA